MYGKGARILGLAPEVKKEDFVAIVNNRAPGSVERLTAQEQHHTDSSRVEGGREVTQTKVPVEEEISNRRVCLDFTFSVPKSLSMYLARTKDAEVEEWNIVGQCDVPGFFYLESRFRLNPGEQPATYTAFELCLHECQFARVKTV